MGKRVQPGSRKLPATLLSVPLCLGLLAGCASYHPAPLPSIAELKVLPGLPAGKDLSLNDVAALAVRNDPGLIAARQQHDVAAADVFSAGLPPDPSINAGFDALISGPGSVPSISAGFSQDLGALITYRVDRQAAQAGLAQVDASILWQEWQVASQAEQLAVAIWTDRQSASSLSRQVAALNGVNVAVAQQIAGANQTLADGSASLAALAGEQAALDTAQQNAAHDLASLDALLGLSPGVDIKLAAPATAPPAAGTVASAIASLPDRRPDLIALQDGYAQADARLRGAILSQFLPISLGATGGRDTTNVFSAGPQITLTLPLFNRNRGAIASATASRAQLAAQYRASLASALSDAEALAASIALLQTQTDSAEAAATQAEQTEQAASRAYAAGEITSTAFANLASAEADREASAISLRGQLQTAEISLATLLGLGLPRFAGAHEEASVT